MMKKTKQFLKDVLTIAVALALGFLIITIALKTNTLNI